MIRRSRRDFFDDFDEDFRRIREEMNRVIDEVFNTDPSEFKAPIVYGFSMRIGPDGKPQLREFGNTRVDEEEGGISEEREPLVDVIEENDRITVIVEIPGVNKEDIELKATENTLSIRVDTESRKYSKVVRLPADVKPETAKANYKNGILEVKMERVEKKAPEDGKTIHVE